MYTTVPRLDNTISDFCEEITQASKPISVPVIPILGSEPLECIKNVNLAITRNGGEMILGWRLWRLRNVMVEAEFHTIWKNSQNELIDVSENELNSANIIFLSDPKLTDTGMQVNNIRKALVDDELIYRFITLKNREFQIFNDGEKAQQFEVELTDEETIELNCIYRESNEILPALQNKYAFDLGPYDMCFCNSGMKYKFCCGKK